MRIHTNRIAYTQTLRRCLSTAQEQGKVARDVHFVVGPEPHGSRTHEYAFEVQLGTYDKATVLPGTTRGGKAQRTRHCKNSGTHGADHVYAATYDEWGHFLAVVFTVDRDARCGPYNGRADFHKKTNDAYLTVTDEHECAYPVGVNAGD